MGFPNEIKELDSEKYYTKDCYGGCNEYLATAYTSGLTNGNASYHMFSIKEIMGGQTRIKVNGNGEGSEDFDIEVELNGDSELRAMVKALKFIVQVFEEATCVKGISPCQK